MRMRVIASVAVCIILTSIGVPAGAKSSSASGMSISGASPNPDCDPGAATSSTDGQDRLDMERDPTLAVNPADPKGLVVAWVQDWDDAITTRSSFDGGQTWSPPQFPPGSTHCPASGPPPAATTVPNSSINPRLSFGPVAADGSQVFYASTLLWDTSTLAYRVVVNTSPDGGRTWNDAVILEVGDFAAQIADWSWVVADPTTPGVAYAAWTVGEVEPGDQVSAHPRLASVAMKMAKTTDGGRTWSAPSFITSALLTALDTCDALPVLRAQRDGTLVVLYRSPSPCSFDAPAALRAMRSVDGGAHWLAPATVATVPGWDSADTVGTAMAKMVGPGLSAPVAGPDGVLWWAWPEVTVDPATNTASTVIRMTSSVDDGGTWSAPATVRTVPFAVMNTNLAVASDGTFGLLSYDFRDEADFAGQWTTGVWFATFRVGGVGWVERRLAMFDANSVPDDVGGYQGVERTRDGFAVAYTAGLPVATIGQTDIFFTTLATRPGLANS